MDPVASSVPSGAEVPPGKGIPNSGGNPALFVTVCPTEIRYTLPGLP
jgi:hypothetical protein